jgi:hypothetical protein
MRSVMPFIILAMASTCVTAPAVAHAQDVGARHTSDLPISLNVRTLLGSEAIVASGTWPASAQIVLTLLATVSTDIPDVVVSRYRITADAAGHFSAAVPIAPNYFRGSILTVVASPPDGSTSVRARITVGAPNEGTQVPDEQLPRSLR